MNGARGNQEVLVFFRRPFIDVALDVKIGSPILRRAEIARHPSSTAADESATRMAGNLS
jgi:hypothetical protein